jgi:sec-independent protein translocase protein TatA
MGLDNPLHWAFIVVILLLVFGARRLPEIGRSLGSGMREFKDAISGETKANTLAPGTQPTQAPANTQPQPVAAQPAPAQPAPGAPPAQPPPPEPVAAQPGASGEQQPNPFGS